MKLFERYESLTQRRSYRQTGTKMPTIFKWSVHEVLKRQLKMPEVLHQLSLNYEPKALDDIAGCYAVTDSNLIMTMQTNPSGKIDRQTTVPFHLKLFYRTGGFHR